MSKWIILESDKATQKKVHQFKIKYGIKNLSEAINLLIDKGFKELKNKK